MTESIENAVPVVKELNHALALFVYSEKPGGVVSVYVRFKGEKHYSLWTRGPARNAKQAKAFARTVWPGIPFFVIESVFQ